MRAQKRAAEDDMRAQKRAAEDDSAFSAAQQTAGEHAESCCMCFEVHGERGVGANIG